MRCPSCAQIILDPKWRFRCLISPAGLGCFHCGKKVKLVGNFWYGAVFGAIILLLGGNFYANDYSLLLSLPCFILGVVVIFWGMLTSRLELLP
jgi:hypothetical protein